MRSVKKISLLLIVLSCAIFISSCCNRPFAAGTQTWPQEDKYPRGPYDLMVRCYRVQTGLCPEPNDKGAKVTILISNFNHQNRLFEDSFETNKYFEDVYAKFAKDGSILVMDEKSGEVIRKYQRVSERHWQCLTGDR